ncbi:hypothetical protein AM218_15450 [Hymenobacter sp. DG25A]|nr:hypothetical protein AM218_15450 [Hymenobacter sp. DG25A]
MAHFYIINKTLNKITIEYTLTPSAETYGNYALKNEIYFNELKEIENQNLNSNSIDDDEIINKSFEHEYFKKISANLEFYSITLYPGTSMHGEGLSDFTYSQVNERHEIFNNIIKMKIIRFDTRDTVILKPASLADFSKPFGRNNIALIFD